MKENKEYRRPYIGITGFMTNEETMEILNLVPTSSNMSLMVGVLASWKTLYENKESNRYPKLEKITKIFPSHPLAINLIHYNTRNTENLCEQLILLNKIGGPNLHGFQLNMTWPPIDELFKYRSSFPENILVLVVTKQAFQEENINVIYSKIEMYKKLVDIDYVLLDQSEGRGIPLNTEFMQKCIEVIKTISGINIVVAGGLSSSTLELIEPLIKKYPGLSVDAEDKLRDGDDHLILNLAKDYVHNALQIYNIVRCPPQLSHQSAKADSCVYGAVNLDR